MIDIKQLTFSYSKKDPLFEELNLELSYGNIYGLLGKNGAGKTSLLKLIAGLIFPSKGTISFDGFSPSERDPRSLREMYFITEVFQLPKWSIRRYLKFYAPFYPRFDDSFFNQMADAFGLPLDRKLTKLSYGQQKKFLLAFGLATNCRLLILDEPTNGLDIPSKKHFRKLLARAINEERSFIISTHQARDMENLIDPIIILDEGEIVFHEYYETIYEKITVGKAVEGPQQQIPVLYSESGVGGYTLVKENILFEQTDIDLETLFNTVLSNKERIHEIFHS